MSLSRLAISARWLNAISNGSQGQQVHRFTTKTLSSPKIGQDQTGFSKQVHRYYAYFTEY